MDAIQSVLVLSAHPDDVELMCGGTLARWIGEGKKVHVLSFTDGQWVGADGETQRDAEAALAEERSAAKVIGYSVENLQQPAMHLRYKDDLVVEVLKRLADHKVDTLICPWSGDLHHDHEVVARIGIAASKRIPRVLHGQINSLLREVFTPNLFVDISTVWETKLKALRCYETEWSRTGGDWATFQDQVTGYYGRLAGVARAEGFISSKFLVD